jgi:signal transduction histidine kinase
MHETGVERRSVAAARAMLLTSGIFLALFVVAFAWFLIRGDDSRSPAAFCLAASVVFASAMLILSVWMLSIANKAVMAERGLELQVYPVRHSPDVIVQFNEALRIVAMNPAAERKFGHSSDSLSGMPMSYLLTPDRPVREAKAEATQTSARRLAMRAGTRLSHLVQPLLGFTEIALDSLEPDHPVRADLQEIGRASSRVVLLAQALEMFGGVRKIQPEAFDLNEFLGGLERDLRFILEPTTQLKFDKSSEPIAVTADPGLTRMAALLLACNAEEAMPPGSTVMISVGSLGLRVMDSGEGVPKEVRAALFRPLMSTKHAERGVGLGLHAARAAMRLQQGDLELTRSSDAGSILTMTFARPVSATLDAEPAQMAMGAI